MAHFKAMGRILRRRIALAVALTAVLAGGTAVALAATGGGRGHGHRARPHHGFAAHHRGGALHVAASYLGLSPHDLREQLRSGKTLAQIADATPGKSEAGLVAALVTAAKARLGAPGDDLEARVKTLVNRTPGGHRHARASRARRAMVHKAIIAYLGIPHHELVQQLKAGRTLAQIADSTPGKSSAGLRELLVKAITAKVGAAVAANNLDEKVQARRLGNLDERVSHLLNRTRLGGHHAAPGASQAPAPSG